MVANDNHVDDDEVFFAQSRQKMMGTDSGGTDFSFLRDKRVIIYIYRRRRRWMLFDSEIRRIAMPIGDVGVQCGTIAGNEKRPLPKERPPRYDMQKIVY